MFSSNKISLVLGVVLVAVISFFVTMYVRHYNAREAVADYKQEVENIRDYPKNYDKGATADKGYLVDAMNYDSKNLEATLLYAQALHDEGHYDEAIKFYSKAISIAPDSTSGYWLRSQAYISLKKYDKAISDATKCIELNPVNYSCYFARARLYGTVGKRVAAIADYDEIINRVGERYASYSSFPMVLNNKAYSLIELGKFYEALPLLNKAITLSPKQDTFYGSRGELYYKVGDYDKSYNDFTRAIRILEGNNGRGAGDNPYSYYYYRGLLHYRLGLVEAAKVDLQKAVDMGSVEAAEPLHKAEQIIGKSLIENI